MLPSGIEARKSVGKVDHPRRRRARTERGLAVARYMKPTHMKPAPKPIVQAIVENCGVVIVGLAD